MYMGVGIQAGQGLGPARQAAIGAGLPVTTPWMTVNKACSSGIIKASYFTLSEQYNSKTQSAVKLCVASV